MLRFFYRDAAFGWPILLRRRRPAPGLSPPLPRDIIAPLRWGIPPPEVLEL